MQGLVHLAVRDFVSSNFGVDKWELVRQKAGVESHHFGRMEDYPDDLTGRLVGAACEVLGVTPPEALRAFGEYWVIYTGREGYGQLFDQAGKTLKEFLFNLDNLHTRVGATFTKLKPPSFQFDVIDDETLKMHYHPGVPTRTGFCPMVEGLLVGLGKRFDTEISMVHTACALNGAPHCEWQLTIAS